MAILENLLCPPATVIYIPLIFEAVYPLPKDCKIYLHYGFNFRLTVHNFAISSILICNWGSLGLVPQVEFLGTVPIDLKTCELKKELGCHIHMEHILMGQVYSNCFRPFSSKSGKMGSTQESIPILKSRRVHVAIYLSGLQYYCLAMVHHGSWLCPLNLISFSIKNGLCDS